ncbi:MAG: TolC family protein [Phycisphaerales bacterium]|nr:TolC family protein [Phycisphaerales bacterium]MCB9862474.1 TolC family protein [Phycisphaerales bacterium]
MNDIKRHASFACLLLIGVSFGCVSYERRPLALESFADKWSSRPLDVEPTRAYLSSLVGDGSAPAHVAFDASDGLSLAEAEAVALHFNPQLRVVRASADVPLASAQEAGWWPDPQFQAGVLRFVNRGGRTGGFKLDNGSFDGVNTRALGPGGLNNNSVERTPPGFRRVDGGDFIDDPWIVNASLSITVPISGRLAVERDLRWADYGAAWRQVAIAEWELLIQLRSNWLAWSVTNKRLSMSREYAERIGAAAEIAGRLASVGELKSTNARVLEIERARMRTAIQALENQAEQQRLGLFGLMGVAPEAPVRLNAELFQPEIGVMTNDRRATLLAGHPRILAARADYEVAEQSFRLEIRKQYPDLNLGPSFSLEEGFSRAGLGFGLPIPLWNRNRQGIAEAFAEREAAKSRAETTVQSAIAELALIETQLAYADDRLAMLKSELAPLVDKQIEETRTLLDLGEVDVLVLREALRASLEAKLDILDATLARAQAANSLQQMLAPRWVAVDHAQRAEEQE